MQIIYRLFIARLYSVHRDASLFSIKSISPATQFIMAIYFVCRNMKMDEKINFRLQLCSKIEYFLLTYHNRRSIIVKKVYTADHAR